MRDGCSCTRRASPIHAQSHEKGRLAIRAAGQGRTEVYGTSDVSPLFHRHRLRQISRLVDIGTAAQAV